MSVFAHQAGCTCILLPLNSCPKYVWDTSTVTRTVTSSRLMLHNVSFLGLIWYLPFQIRIFDMIGLAQITLKAYQIHQINCNFSQISVNCNSISGKSHWVLVKFKLDVTRCWIFIFLFINGIDFTFNVNLIYWNTAQHYSRLCEADDYDCTQNSKTSYS